MINYKDLLKRYISHIANMEGITFIDSVIRVDEPDYCGNDVKFTEEEIKELNILDND